MKKEKTKLNFLTSDYSYNVEELIKNDELEVNLSSGSLIRSIESIFNSKIGKKQYDAMDKVILEN
jgi:hypothetical protein